MIMAQFRHRNVISLIGIVLQHNPAPLLVCCRRLFSRRCLHVLSADGVHEDREVGQTYPPLHPLPAITGHHGNRYRVRHELSQHSALCRRGLCTAIVLCCNNFPQNLAARNILVDDNNVCKISDFGLSRDMSDPLNTVSSKQSFKWIALGLNLHGCLGDSLTLLRAPTSPGASTPRLC